MSPGSPSNKPPLYIKPPPPSPSWDGLLFYQLEVHIWFWSSAAWPPTFLFLSFSTLCSSSLRRTDTIVFSKLKKLPPPSNGLDIEELHQNFVCYG